MTKIHDSEDAPQDAARDRLVVETLREASPDVRSFEAARYPELAAMLTIHEALEHQSKGACARVLGAAALLTCPHAFTDEQWLAILQQARQP